MGIHQAFWFGDTSRNVTVALTGIAASIAVNGSGGVEVSMALESRCEYAEIWYGHMAIPVNGTAVLTGNAATVSGGSVEGFDVFLLLHGDGTDGGTTFVDSSSYNHAVTSLSGVINTATDAQAFAGSSIKFSATVGGTISYDLPFATTTEPFTLDYWMRVHNSVGAGDGFANRRGQFLAINTSDGAYIHSANGLINSAVTLLFTTPFANAITPSSFGITSVTDRVHVRYVRDASGFGAVFFNGRYVAQNSAPALAVTNLVIGSTGTTKETGAYIEEVRFIKNKALTIRTVETVGTVMFTVPSSAFPNP